MTATSSPAEPPESTLAAALADALNRDALSFKDGGWGSNPIDLARLEGIGWVLEWLRDGRAAAILAATPTAETGCVLDGHDGSQLCPPDCWNGTTCFATDPSRWAPPDTTAAHVAHLEAALAAAEARLRAVEALADAARGTWFYACECGFQDYPPPEGHECTERALAWNLDPTEVRAALTPPQPAP